MKIKIIRKTENGPAQGQIFEARPIRAIFGNDSFQILSDGAFLGDIVNWLDAIVVEAVDTDRTEG